MGVLAGPGGARGVPGVPSPANALLLQATDRPLLGVNGLDMAGLRPFDLVIPFTIKKGEITGEGGRGDSRGGSPKGPRDPQGGP